MAYGDSADEESGRVEFELGTDGPAVILAAVDDSVTAARAGWCARAGGR